MSFELLKARPPVADAISSSVICSAFTMASACNPAPASGDPALLAEGDVATTPRTSIGYTAILARARVSVACLIWSLTLSASLDSELGRIAEGNDPEIQIKFLCP